MNKERSFDLEQYRKDASKYFKTQGHEKLWNAVQRMIRSDYIQSIMVKLRSKYKIPLGGYPENERTNDQNYYLPAIWFKEASEKKFYRLSQDIKNICRRLGINYMEWDEVLYLYLFFGKLEVPPGYQNMFNLFSVDDAPKPPKGSGESEEFDFLSYPIVLRVSAYASCRDIVNYVNQVYKVGIEPLQKKHQRAGSIIGKARAANPHVEERNDFVYENQMPWNKIKSKLAERRETIKDPKIRGLYMLDPAQVTSIRSLERKRRKQV